MSDIQDLIKAGFIKNPEGFKDLTTKKQSKPKRSTKQKKDEWKDYLKYQEKVMLSKGVSKKFVKQWVGLMNDDKELKKLMGL